MSSFLGGGGQCWRDRSPSGWRKGRQVSPKLQGILKESNMFVSLVVGRKISGICQTEPVYHSTDNDSGKE